MLYFFTYFYHEPNEPTRTKEGQDGQMKHENNKFVWFVAKNKKPRYTLTRPRKLRESVRRSVYSRSPPTGSPDARRVTSTGNSLSIFCK